MDFENIQSIEQRIELSLKMGFFIFIFLKEQGNKKLPGRLKKGTICKPSLNSQLGYIDPRKLI